jgi:hypothetical protein
MLGIKALGLARYDDAGGGGDAQAFGRDSRSEEMRGLPRSNGGRPDFPRGGPAHDAGGMGGHRRPHAPPARHDTQEGGDGRTPEGACRHAAPHARGTGEGVVPEPVAQLAADGTARRQGRGKALRHVRSLPHGRQDLLLPDDAGRLGEPARFPPLHRADGRLPDARDALGDGSRRDARVSGEGPALRQGMVRAGDKLDGAWAVRL